MWVVSTDGLRQDFSYRKCLDNFVREKYPDLAEEFLSKYFTPVLPPVAEEEKREENEEEKREETTQEEKGEETTQE